MIVDFYRQKKYKNTPQNQNFSASTACFKLKMGIRMPTGLNDLSLERQTQRKNYFLHRELNRQKLHCHAEFSSASVLNNSMQIPKQVRNDIFLFGMTEFFSYSVNSSSGSFPA